MRCTIRLATAALLLAWPGATWAQRVPAPAPERPPTTPPSAEPGTRIPDRLLPPGASSGSEAPMGGVLSPGMNPDPGMSVMPPMPAPGASRVIPPPGTPGGNPDVQPR